VVERFLFDRIDDETARSAVRREHDFATAAGAHETQAALSFVQPTMPWTNVALRPAVIGAMPITRADDRVAVGKVRCRVEADHGYRPR
jgi:hypothetical protein